MTKFQRDTDPDGTTWILNRRENARIALRPPGIYPNEAARMWYVEAWRLNGVEEFRVCKAFKTEDKARQYANRLWWSM